MKNLKHKRKPEPRNGVGSTALLGHTSYMVIQGYITKQGDDGKFFDVPVSLAQQLRGVKAALGANPLKQTVHITLKHFSADTVPNRLDLGGRNALVNNGGFDKPTALAIV